MDDIPRPDDELIIEYLIENLHKVLKNVEKMRKLYQQQKTILLKIEDHDRIQIVEKELIALQEEKEKAEKWIRFYESEEMQ